MSASDNTKNGLYKKRDELKEKIRATQEKIFATRQRMEDGKETLIALAKERTQKQTRLEYLAQKCAVREMYSVLSLSNDERQRNLKFFGIRPKKMDVVHFHIAKSSTGEEVDGVALVRDENHYYLAVDLYNNSDDKNNVTTIMDENPDGTFEGIWPKTVELEDPSKFEERYMREIADKYADDLDAAEKFIQQTKADEDAEIKRLKSNIEEINQQISVYQKDNDMLNEASAELSQFNEQLDKVEKELNSNELGTGQCDPESDYEPMEGLDLDTDIEKMCPHLPYLRGKRQMTTMNWPAIDTELKPWLRYRQMANIARIVDKIKDCHALTYVLSEEYFEELSSRGCQYYKSMIPEDVVSEKEVSCGVLVYPFQGFHDTIIYNIGRRNLLSMQLIYIRENRLMFYESYSEQEIIGHPRTDTYMCTSLREAGTEPNRLFVWIRNLVVSFLAMENDMERTVNRLMEEGEGSAEEKRIEFDDIVDTTDDMDVVIRDANWYTDITANRQIPVRGYISHRLCGSGKDKYIREVWVRPHVKQGYHRTAGVKK